mgnify:CR=1 FL=1
MGLHFGVLVILGSSWKDKISPNSTDVKIFQYTPHTLLRENRHELDQLGTILEVLNNIGDLEVGKKSFLKKNTYLNTSRAQLLVNPT